MERLRHEVMRREADAYIEEEEEAMRELQTNALPEGSVLERRKIDKDLTLSINKREGALHGTSGSGSMKRHRDGDSSFSSLPALNMPLAALVKYSIIPQRSTKTALTETET